jgi:hypothetical protein
MVYVWGEFYMKVKNYIIENCYVFIDELERELCKRGISYVRIDREIHFLNQIIRLYDFELDRDIIYSRLINGISLKNQNILCHELSECIDFMPEKNNINKLSYQRQNKKSLKYESKMVSQKIKKYSK